MLSTLLVWTYMTALAFIYGEGCFAFMASRQDNAEGEPAAGPIRWMVGFAMLSALAASLNFVIEIGLWANLAVAGAGLLLVLIYRATFMGSLGRVLESARTIRFPVWVLGLAIFLVVLIRATERPLNYDTGLYHAQAIRWIEEYPVLPGLGNLHDPFGYNSAWFPPAALFSLSFLDTVPLRPTGGFLFLLAAAFGLSKSNELLKGRISLESMAALLSLFLLRRFLSWELSSPGTDLPAAVVIWAIILLSLGKIERRDRAFDQTTAALWILGAFAFTVKINTALVLILPLYFALQAWKHLTWRAGGPLGLVLAALILPWLARSRLLSGYLFYPVAWLDIFDVDWKIPPELASLRVGRLRAWARLPGENKDVVLATPLREWVPIWYAQQEPLLRQVLALSVVGAAVLAVAAVVWTVTRNRRSQAQPPYAILYFTVGAGTVIWFLGAPAFRFGWGFLGALLILLYAPIVLGLLQIAGRGARQIVIFLALALLLYQGIGLYNSRDIAALRARLLYPVDYPEARTETSELGNFTVHMPRRGDQCWYAPLPCTPIHNPEVNLRGSGFEAGFFVKTD